MDKEWKTKSTVLKLFTDKQGNGQMVGMDVIKKELELRDQQIQTLEIKVLDLHHSLEGFKKLQFDYSQLQKDFDTVKTSNEVLKK